MASRPLLASCCVATDCMEAAMRDHEWDQLLRGTVTLALLATTGTGEIIAFSRMKLRITVMKFALLIIKKLNFTNHFCY